MIPFPADETRDDPCTRVECVDCHRPLTHPKSRKRKRGRDCDEKHRAVVAGPRFVRLARVRAGGDVDGQTDLFGEWA